MNDAPILPDDEPPSMPSLPTQWGGDPATLGRIDHYDLLCKLGGGGFGVVYLARDTVSGIEVAIKTLHPLLKHNAEEMDNLREKFALVSRLAHTNIATALVLHPVRDIGVYDEDARRELKLSPGDSVMVMRYAPGVTLSKWRRQFPGGIVPIDLALEVGRQVASALDYAHSERIVHRDIKPSNVMVETVAAEPRPLDHGQNAARSLSAPTLRVRILDFGLAAEIRSSMSRVSTESGDTSGTRPYMAPEQWLGKKQDGRTDQYALACVLYELLSGAPPFAGVFETGDPVIMMATVKGETPDEIEDVSPDTNEALLRALSKMPNDRFPTCAALVEALCASMEGRDDSTNRPPFGRAVGASLPDGAGRGEPQGSAALEADVLRRKVALTRALAAIPEAVRKDSEFSTFVTDAELEADAVKEALDRTLMDAAAACLDRAVAVLAKLGEARKRREEEEARRKEEEARRKAQEIAERKPGVRKVVSADGVELALRWCPPGSFTMGSPSDEDGRDSGETQHRVTLTTGFWMGETEVTQGLWKKVMGGNNPSHFKSGDDYPVENVSWNDCQDFLKKLNAQASVAGFRWTLPTEAQWEYACRAGTTTAYFWGNALNGDKANCDGNYPCGTTSKGSSKQKTTIVGSYAANPWGLYDMHGNVWEWCADWYGSYPSGTVTDPAGPSSGSSRVYRGGSWYSIARYCRSAYRSSAGPGDRKYLLGFRVALVPVR